MASVIGSRTSALCKSHHQKLLIKYKSIEGIISELTK